MNINPLKLSICHAQTRLEYERLAMLVQGSYPGPNGKTRVPGWEAAMGSNVWFDEVTYTLMLRPAPLHPEWSTTGTGIYERLRKSDFTFDNPTEWEEQEMAFDGDYWLFKSENENELATTEDTFPKNRGFVLSWFAYSVGSEKFAQIECGWTPEGSGGPSVHLTFYTSGEVDIYRDGLLIDTQRISGHQASQDVGNKFTQVLLIPCRRRELLVVSNQGDGFSHIVEQIEANDPDPTITPAGRFWFRVATGGAMVQCAPLRYPTSGYGISTEAWFAYPPELGAGQAPGFVYYDPAFYGAQSVSSEVRNPDDVSQVFVADGKKKRGRVRVNLNGDGNSTPFVYGALAGYAPTHTTTDDSEQEEISDKWRDASISVGDSPDAARLNLVIRDPSRIEVPKIDIISNRPVKATLGDDQWLFDGRFDAPRIRRGLDTNTDYLELSARDYWAQLERVRFRDRVPLDGYDFKAVIEWLLYTAGVPDSMYDIEDPVYQLPSNQTPTAGEWGLLIEEMQTVAEWIERLFEAFAGDWIYGFFPRADGIKFEARSPQGMSKDPVRTLYDDTQEAIDALVAEGHEEKEARIWAHTLTYSSLTETRIMPETTEVRVTGVDGRRNRYIQAYYIDRNAGNPQTAPSMQGDNWLGESLLYAYTDPILRTQAACDRAAQKLGDRMTRVRYMAEWSGGLIIRDDGAPAWRGDVVELKGRGLYRIIAFEANFELEPSEDKPWARRTARYTAERLTDDEPPWGRSTGAMNLNQIAQAQLALLRDRAFGFGRPALQVARGEDEE